MARKPVHYVKRRVGISPRQRLAAWGALLCYGVGFVVLVVLVISRPLYALGVLALTLAFLVSVFVAVTSQGFVRRLTTVVAVVCGLTAAGAVLFWRPDERSISGVVGAFAVVLFILGTFLSRHALWVPPPTGPELFNVEPGTRVTRHPVLILNLKSGGGKAKSFDLPGACKEFGIEAVILEPGARLEELAEDAVSRGADALGMAGGDGSLAFVASVAAAHDLPFVAVPAGTRNHFALDAGLDRTDPRQALSAFLNGEERRIDYATVNGSMFLNNVSLGVYAAIVEQDSYQDAKVDTTLSLLPKLWADGGPWFDLQFDVPDHGRLERAAILQVSNNPYDSLEAGRRTRLDTGELGMVTVDPQRIADLVGITLLTVAGQPDKSSALWSWAAPTLRVESGQAELASGIDGETVSLTTPIEFAAVPSGLRLLLPPGSRVGVAEQELGSSRYTGLFSVALGLERVDD